MDKDKIEKRLFELKKTLEQIQANGNATIGAISECEYWLKEVASLTPIAGVATARETEHVTN